MKEMCKKSRTRLASWARVVVFSLCLGISSVSVPCTAHAFASVIVGTTPVLGPAIMAVYSAISGLYASLASMTNVLLLDTASSVRASAKSELTGINAQNQVFAAGAQGHTDLAAAAQMTAQQAAASVEKGLPEPGDQLLCNTITARQLFVSMTRFADIVTDMVTEGLMLRYRGPGADGSGGQYIKDMFDLRCGNLAEGGINFTNPEDGITCPNAAPNTGSAYDREILIDADLDMTRALSGEYGLEVPPMKEVTETLPDGTTRKLTLPNPDLNNLAQVRFLAAQQLCANAMGPRPSPPYGKQMNTQKGKAARAQYDHCATRQSVFARACARWIGVLSAPSCEKLVDPKTGRMDEGEPEFRYFCEASRSSCAAAKAAGVQLPASIGGCKYGLSLHEAGQISALLCTAGKATTSTQTLGDDVADVIENNELCTKTQIKINTLWRKEKENFSKALRNLGDLKSCWPDYQKELDPPSN